MDDKAFQQRMMREHPMPHDAAGPHPDTGELLPCPFCGGEASLEEVKDHGSVRWSVGCNETDADPDEGAFAVLCYGYQSLTTFATQREARAAWNRRAK